MSEKTQKITTGAMFTAIFAILLLVNRQTGGMFEEMVMFLLPIPMVGYSSKYGFKSGLPVLAAMGLISVIVSTPTAIFYGVTESVIGLVLGSAVFGKRDMTRTMLVVMGLSAIVNVLNTIVLASLFGYDLASEIKEARGIWQEALVKYGQNKEAMDNVLAIMTPEFMLKMMVISMVLLGFAQGFVVYKLSLLILRRLKFYVPKPKSIYSIQPPMWTGFVAVLFFCGYNYLTYKQYTGMVVSTFQMLGICGYLYLVILGMICVALLCKKYVSKNGILGVIISVALLFIFPMIELFLGLMYLMPNYYEKLVEGMQFD